MKKINFIIPLNVYNEEVERYLNTCLLSIKNCKGVSKDCTVTFVGPKDVVNSANALYASLKIKLSSKIIENNETDFASQVNTAVMATTLPYFSIIEFDDQITPNWINSLENFTKNSDAMSVYMPINEYVDTNGHVVCFANEIAWANSFVNEMGVIDMDCLENYIDFNLTGAIFKTEDFISVGLLKPSLKLAMWYELLLRMAYNNKSIYVVPKIGYKHTINRDGSYMVNTRAEIKPDEGEWLIKTAKQEYFFKEDRNKKFGED